MNRNDNLSPNFKLSEFLRKEDPMPSQNILNNLIKLAYALEMLRAVLRKPIHINSGYRTPAHNASVGGEKNSYHLKGMAADISVPGVAPSVVQEFLMGWSGGLGSYSTFTHVDIGPYRRW